VLRGNPNSGQSAIEHIGSTSSTVRLVESVKNHSVRALLCKIAARQTSDCRSIQRGSTEDPNEWAPPNIAAFAAATSACAHYRIPGATGRTLMRYLLPKIYFAATAVFAAHPANASEELIKMSQRFRKIRKSG
jgi:hypothetical protein